MKTLTVSLMLLGATAAAAQGLVAPGAATYPSPGLGRHFLDSPVAQCVIATPVSVNAVVLTPCPPGTLVPPPAATQLPAPAPPPVVTAPIAPTAEPKSVEAKEPVVIRIEVVPVAPATKATPLPAPKAAPKKKECPCP